MATDPFYSTGTITVAANGTTVTGSGTAWIANALAGDEIIANDGAGGYGRARITTDPISDTALAITPWEGPSLSGAAYTIAHAVRWAPSEQVWTDVAALLSGVSTLAAHVSRVDNPHAVTVQQAAAASSLTAAADRGIFFTSGSAVALFTLTSSARTLLAGASMAAIMTALGITAAAQSVLDDTTTAAMLTTLGVTAAAQTVLDDTSIGAMRTTLGVREKVTANRTYYVAASGGSDSNDGLTSGTAFATMTKAWNTLCALDLAGFSGTIQLLDGTHTTGLSTSGSPFGGNVTINGNAASPGNVIISTTSATCLTFNDFFYHRVTIQNFKMQTTTSGHCIYLGRGGVLQFGAGLNFGACAGTHIVSRSTGGVVVCAANYTISGGAVVHYEGDDQGSFKFGPCTVTLTGTPAFSAAFAYSSRLGFIDLASVAFSGSATGARYSAGSNSLINTYGGGASFLPGNAAGSTSTGGQYV